MNRSAISNCVRRNCYRTAILGLVCVCWSAGIGFTNANDDSPTPANSAPATERRGPSPWDKAGTKPTPENKVQYSLFLESEGFAALEELLNYINAEKQKPSDDGQKIQKPIMIQDRLQNFHFLGIGINNYQSSHLKPLNAPVRDVVRLAEVFGSQQSIDSEIITKRRRMLYDQSATKAEIERQLTDLPNWVEDDATIVIAFSGHGGRFGGKWFMTTYDCDGERPEDTCVSAAFLIRSIDALIKARRSRVVLIIDACYSGSLMTSVEPLLGKYQDPKQGGLIVLLSSIASETSLDGTDGSLFAQLLWSGLKGFAHTAPSDAITVKELRRYLRASMPFQRRFDYKISKLPGVNTPEQNFLFETSLSISEELGIVKANPNYVFSIDTQLPTESPEPSSLARVVDSKESVVGVWKYVRLIQAKPTLNSVLADQTVYVADKKGKLYTEEITLTLTNIGYYKVEYRSPEGKSEEVIGRYRFQPGIEFSLSYAQGTDYLSVDELTKTRFVISLPEIKLTSAAAESQEDALKRLALGKKDPSKREWVFTRVEQEQAPK